MERSIKGPLITYDDVRVSCNHQEQAQTVDSARPLLDVHLHAPLAKAVADIHGAIRSSEKNEHGTLASKIRTRTSVASTLATP